jgi:hypothetical protein
MGCVNSLDLQLTQRSDVLLWQLDQHTLTAAPFPSVAVEVPSVGFGRRPSSTAFLRTLVNCEIR